MTKIVPFPFASPPLLLLLLLAGCIEDDPQVEAMRNRLQSTELEIAALKDRLAETEVGSMAPGDGGAKGGLAARIRELEAEVARLLAEQERVRTGARTESGVLSEFDLLDGLKQAGAPMREQIKALYEIEQSGVTELIIPERPYSCVIRLQLLNLATREREVVSFPATANLKGEWNFPTLEQIANRIVPLASLTSQPVPPVAAASAPPLPPQAEPARPLPEREAPPAAPVPGRRAPAGPVPGELAGETVLPLNW